MQRLGFSRITQHSKLVSLMLLAGFLTALALLLGFTYRHLSTTQNATQQARTPGFAAEPDDPQVIRFADIDFAKKKLLYHQLAAILADKARVDATRPEIRLSAEELRSREAVRAEAYAQLLRAWEEPYFNITDFPETKGCHGYPTFTGMLPYGVVGEYRLSSGPAVDETYYSLLISHHEGNEELIRVEGARITDKTLTQLNADISEDLAVEKKMLASEQSVQTLSTR